MKGYPVTIIMPDSVSEERRYLVSQYGAQVILVHDDGDIGACIARCMELAQEMAQKDPRVFIPQQFVNPDNPEVHRRFTAREILEEAEGPIDGFCSGVGTGGTISGIGEVLREQNPGMTIWAVEPENAAILSGGSVGTHLQMGIGDGLIPANLNTAIYDEVCVVTDEEALGTARKLAAREGILCGISSGSNVAAALRLAGGWGRGSGWSPCSQIPESAILAHRCLYIPKTENEAELSRHTTYRISEMTGKGWDCMENEARRKIDLKYKWRIEDIYPTKEAWERELEELPSLVEKVSSFRGRLGKDSASFREGMACYEHMSRQLERSFCMPNCKRIWTMPPRNIRP